MYQPTMTYQVLVKRGNPFPIKLEEETQYDGRVPIVVKQCQGQPLMVGVPKEDQVIQL